MARASISFGNTSGAESLLVRWNAPEIAKYLRMGKDEHIGLVKLRGRESVLAAATELFCVVDLVRKESTFDPLEGGIGPVHRPVEKRPAIAGAMKHRGLLEIHVDSGDSFIAEDSVIEPLEVFDSIVWAKGATAVWTGHLDFVYLEGSMRWPQEDYWKDMRKVGRERSAGRPFFQVGNRFALGQRNQ